MEHLSAALRKCARVVVSAIARTYAVRKNVSIGRNVHIGLGTVLWGPTSLRIGDHVYIGKGCTIEVDGEIGAGTMIANGVGLVGRRDHDVRTEGVPVRFTPWVGDEIRLVSRVSIGVDAWIGYGAIIVGPCSIGRGAVVAAGSVVTRDVAPYAIVAGVPAAHIGRRFELGEVSRHEFVLERDFGIPAGDGAQVEADNP